MNSDNRAVPCAGLAGLIVRARGCSGGLRLTWPVLGAEGYTDIGFSCSLRGSQGPGVFAALAGPASFPGRSSRPDNLRIRSVCCLVNRRGKGFFLDFSRRSADGLPMSIVKAIDVAYTGSM